ncbi:MAG: tetratricopeptide repeat protein [Flavobacterium sp.]|nr:tetratricopeptide repeat protein [Flavobacterium sp.]
MRTGNFCIVIVVMLAFGCNNNDPANNGKPSKDAAFIKKLAKAVAENRDSTGLRFNYIAALDSVGDYSTAIAQMDSLILKDGGNYGLWFKLGKIYEHAGDTAQAIGSYQTALKIYRSPDGLLALINLLAETKNVLVFALCDEVDNLRLGREYDSYTNFFRGVYYSRTGKKQQAIGYFDKSIINNYTFIDAYMEKGFTYFDDKKFDEAITVFLKVAEVNSTYADAYYWQGKCFEAKGNKPKAVEMYGQALVLDKTLQQAEDAIKRLQP